MSDRLRDFRIEIRLTLEERSFLIESAKKLGLSLSDYIRVMTIKEPKSDSKLLEIYQKIIKYSRYILSFKENKRTSFYLYLDKNGMRRIIDSARFSQYHNGKINMNEIKLIIKNIKNVYDQMPDEIKELKKESMKEIENCAIEKYLITKLKMNYNQIIDIQRTHNNYINETSTKLLKDSSEQKRKNEKKN